MNPSLVQLAGQSFMVEPAAAERWLEQAQHVDPQAWFGLFEQWGERPAFKVSGRDAIVPVTGMLTRSHDSGWLFMGSTYEGIADAVAKAAADPAVDRVVLEIDSLGGSTSGMLTACRAVAACPKPTLARVVGMGASAALFLGLAASRIEAHATATLGSIGCVVTIETGTETPGRVRFVSRASPNKHGNPTEATAAAVFQQLVDDLGDEFVAFVAARRGIPAAEIPTRFGGGALFSARRALSLGLIDQITEARPEASAPAQAEEAPVTEEEQKKRIEELEAENAELKRQIDEANAGGDEGDEDADEEMAGEGEDGEGAAEAADPKAAAAAARAEAAAKRAETSAARVARVEAGAVFRAMCAIGMVTPAQREGVVGPLAKVFAGRDDVPDDFAGTVALCKKVGEGKGATADAARQWLSCFGNCRPNGAVDFGTHTSADGGAAGAISFNRVGFTSVRAALMGDGLTPEMQAQLGVTEKGGKLTANAANHFILDKIPALYLARAKS